MLNMNMETSINSIPFLCTMNRQEKIEAMIKDFIKYKRKGYNINSIKHDILTAYGFNENLLTDSECNYIMNKVDSTY